MTGDAKPIEFKRDGVKRLLTVETVDHETAPYYATPGDLAAAIKAMSMDQRNEVGNLLIEGLGDASWKSWDELSSALESATARVAELETANVTVVAQMREEEAAASELVKQLDTAQERIAELEAERDSYLDQLIAWLDSVSESNRAHLEEAADLLREKRRFGIGADPSELEQQAHAIRYHTWHDRDQALRAKPSPAGKRAADARQRIELEALDREPAPANPHSGSSLESAFTPEEWSEIQEQVKPSPAGERAADARQRIELEAMDGEPEPAGEKDLPELCPVVGCGCDGCTYCHDNHDDQTRCSCQCEYYREPAGEKEPTTADVSVSEALDRFHAGTGRPLTRPASVEAGGEKEPMRQPCIDDTHSFDCDTDVCARCNWHRDKITGWAACPIIEPAASPAPVDWATEEVTSGEVGSFGCDPEDSAALLRLREAIDAADLWPSEMAKEQGDYEFAVRYMASRARANDHTNACSGSNEPGQPGSAYSAPPAPVEAPLTSDDDRPPGAHEVRVFLSADGSTLAFPSGAFTTVRACRHCGVLIAGGPTACVGCVERIAKGGVK